MLEFLAQHSIPSDIPVVSSSKKQRLGLKVANGAIATLKKARGTENPCSWLLALARCDILECSSNELALRIGEGIASNTITGLEGGKANLNQFSHPISKLIRYFNKVIKDGSLDASKSADLARITEAILDLSEEKYAKSAPTLALINRWRYEYGPELVQQLTGIGYSKLSQMALDSNLIQPDQLLEFARKLEAIDPKLTTEQLLEDPCYLKISAAYRSHAILLGRPEAIINLETKLAACNSRITSKGVEGDLKINIRDTESRKLLAYLMIPYEAIQPIVKALDRRGLMNGSEIKIFKKQWNNSLALQPLSLAQELADRAKELKLENRHIATLVGINWQNKQDSSPVRDALSREVRSSVVPVGALIYLLARDEADLQQMLVKYSKEVDLEVRRKFSIVRNNLYKELKLWSLEAKDLGLDPAQLSVLAVTQSGPLENKYQEILLRAKELGLEKAKKVLLNWFSAFNSSSYVDYIKLAAERVPRAQLASAAHVAPSRLRDFLDQNEIPNLPEFSTILAAASIPLLPEALMSWHQAISKKLLSESSNELERILRAYLLELGESATEHQRKRGWQPGHKSPFRNFFSDGIITREDFNRWLGSKSELPWSDLAVRSSAEPQLLKLYQAAAWNVSDPLYFILDSAFLREVQRVVKGRGLEDQPVEPLFRLKTRINQLYNNTAAADHPTFKRLERVTKIIKSFPGISADEIVGFAESLAPKAI